MRHRHHDVRTRNQCPGSAGHPDGAAGLPSNRHPVCDGMGAGYPQAIGVDFGRTGWLVERPDNGGGRESERTNPRIWRPGPRGYPTGGTTRTGAFGHGWGW